MRRTLIIALAALMLSGCIAEWKNPNGPQKWKDQPVPSSSSATGQAGDNPIR